MRFKRRYLLALLVMAVGALLPSPAAAATAPTLVASGFDAPRGVAFFHGKLVVAEAGHGGKNCIAAPMQPVACFGRTGKISWGTSGPGPHPVLVDKLFAMTEAFGPNPDSLGLGGLSTRGGQLMAIEGIYPQFFKDYKCAAGDSQCDGDLAAAKKEAGALLAVQQNGHFKVVANVGAHDFDFTGKVGAPQEHDSNPYGVLAVPGGSLVADAGSNTLDFVSNGGHVSILNYWPNKYAAFPSDEVPTCAAFANDSLYVATLSGHLYRVHGASADPVKEPDLVHVTGCTSDENDNIYFVNIFTTPFPSQASAFTGNIVQFKADSGASSVIAAHLNFPNMDIVGPDRNLYFSADSVCLSGGVPGFCPMGGTVMKLALPNADNNDNNQN